MQKLDEYQKLGTENIKELENARSMIIGLEREAAILGEDLQRKDIDIDNSRNQLVAKDKEIQDQRSRYDAELEILKNESHNEKGNTTSLLIDFENTKRELASVKEEAARMGMDNTDLCSRLKSISESKEVLESNLKLLESNNSALAGSLQASDSLAAELQAIETEKKELVKKLEDLQAIQEASEKQHGVLKEECLILNKSVKEMETSMDHMVDKLNNAELKMNESIHEHNELQEKLQQMSENNLVLVTQKAEIEIALEEFVKSTGSRKRRSGRTNNDEVDAGRLTPNEGLLP